jgi:hypothetical protein
MSKNLTKTQKHTHIVTNWWRSLSTSRSPTVIVVVAAVVAVIAAVAAVVTVAAVVAVGAAVVEDEVAAVSLLYHEEVLELLSQPVDPKGETLHAWVLVHIMMCLDVMTRVFGEENPSTCTLVIVPGSVAIMYRTHYRIISFPYNEIRVQIITFTSETTW